MSEPRKRRMWPFVLLAGVGLLSVPALIGASVWMSAQSEQKVEPGTFLELKIAGGLTEGPSPAGDFLAELSPGSISSIWDVRQALRRAADDEAVSGMLITLEGVAMGTAAQGELIDEIVRFRDAGKPVHVLMRSDMVTEPELNVATAGSTIWATPHAMWMVNGFQADVAFYKGALDKIHVEPDFIMFKEYKSAGEPYSREEMSEYFREAITDVVGDIQDNLWAGIVERRGVERDAFMTLVDRGAFSPEDAQEIGLIDNIGYLDQVRDALVSEAGVDEWEGLSLGKYLKNSKSSTPEDAQTVAVIFGEGPIVASSADQGLFGGSQQISGPKLAAAFRDAVEDEDVKAIVFRVNSPGGSAVGNDLIWREIKRAQEAGKPVIVSMSSVAGSGGYWIAMAADSIVVRPDTITGSIGVVFGKFNVRGLYEWAGANVDSVSFAENADIMSPYETMSEEQRATMVGAIGVMYDGFTAKVAEGRGMPEAKVKQLAKGRIWSGQDAVENGLADKIGGMDVALDEARAAAELGDGPLALTVYPRKKDFFEQLLLGELEFTTPEITVDPLNLQVVLDELTEPNVRVMMPEITLR